MAIRVLVIGQHDPREDLFEDAVDRVGLDTNTFAMVRCSTRSELFNCVRKAVRQLNGPIAELDLYDHGGNGYMRMGDPLEPPLFADDHTGEDIARDLSELLTHDARVRLLGCETGNNARGKRLLLNLQEAFRAFGKAIVVYGTLQVPNPDIFVTGGFDLVQEHHLLFSSTEAAKLGPDELPPTYDARAHEIVLWRRKVG